HVWSHVRAGCARPRRRAGPGAEPAAATLFHVGDDVAGRVADLLGAIAWLRIGVHAPSVGTGLRILRGVCGRLLLGLVGFGLVGLGLLLVDGSLPAAEADLDVAAL